MVGLFFSTSCQTLPERNSPPLPVDLPSTYSTTAEARGPMGWVHDFQDAMLFSLVEEGLHHNHDLVAAAWRIEAAKANAAVTGADRFPSISAGAEAGRAQRLAMDDSKVTANTFGLDLSASWEADLWGRIRHTERAALHEVIASEADLISVRHALAASIARSWFNLVEAHLQVELAVQTLANYSNSLEVVESGFARGVTRAVDVRLTRTDIATARGRLAAEQRQQDAARRTLLLLTGLPQSTPPPTGHLELPELTETLPAGVPAELLIRRPDLRAANARLGAALDRLNAADRALLPGLRLTGSIGTSSDELEEVLDPDRLIWNLLAGLAQPIFQGGQLRETVHLRDATHRAAVETFAQDVLEALQEVETALAAETWLRQQVAALDDAVNESRDTDEQALDDYIKGLSDFLTVLETQRRAFNARSSLLSARNALLQNRINLYLAIGGEALVLE